jgi:hypothetical protein
MNSSVFGQVVVEFAVAEHGTVGEHVAVRTDIVVRMFLDVNHRQPIGLADDFREGAAQFDDQITLDGSLQARTIEHEMNVGNAFIAVPELAVGSGTTDFILEEADTEDLRLKIRNAETIVGQFRDQTLFGLQIDLGKGNV